MELNRMQNFSILITVKDKIKILTNVDISLIFKGNQYRIGEAYLYRVESSESFNVESFNKYPGAVGNAIFRKDYRLAFHSPSSYSNLYEILNKQLFITCLNQLDELGYLFRKNYRKYEKTLLFLEKKAVTNPRSRSEEIYFLKVLENVSKNSEEIEFLIGKRARKEFKKIRTAYFINKSLMGFSNNHEFEIDINNSNSNEISQSAYIFVGSNGLGKTQCLLELYNAIDTDNYYESNLLWFGFSRPRSVFNQQFHKLNTAFSNLNFEKLFKDILINSSRNFDRISFFQEEVKKVLRCDHVIIKVGGIEYLGEKNNSFLNERFLKNVSVEFYNNNQKLILSSGQSTYVNLLCLILSNIEINDILFLDEVDAFFHPRLCSDFIQSLNSILKRTNSIAFFITHSVFTAREVITPNVFHFSAHEDLDGSKKIFIKKPTFNTFGASIDRLADYLFENETMLQAVDQLTDLEKKSNLVSVDARTWKS